MPESLNHADPTDKFSVIGTCHIRSGLLPSQCPFEVIRVGLARTDDFRSTPINRHRCRVPTCLKGANKRLIRRKKEPRDDPAGRGVIYHFNEVYAAGSLGLHFTNIEWDCIG